MKKTFYIQLIVTMLLALCSCDKWLDLTPTDRLSDKIIWENEESVNKYVNGFYTYIHQYGQFGGAQSRGNLTESLTDAFKYGSYVLGDLAGFPNQYVITPEVISPTNCFYDNWADGYNKIRRLNQFLDEMSKYSTLSAEKNKLIESQVKFFRAFIYFHLAKRHGGVLLYTSLDEINKNKALSSEEETWDLIQSDLDFAADNLPNEWSSVSDKGRVTKHVAYALQSRAMLYAQRWQKAYDAATEVINSSKYSLVDNYANSWKGNNSESILEFKYEQSGPNHTFDRNYVPISDGWDFGGRGTPTQEMVECYEKADGTKINWNLYHVTNATRPPYESLEPRFKATIIYPGSTWKNKVMQNSVGSINGSFMEYRSQPNIYGYTTTGYYLRKLLDENLIDISGTPSTQTWVEIRYAEVLLNKAEAAYRLNKIGEAQNLMNQVRTRVNLPGKTSTGDQWFKDYRNERKVELAFEGHLFWDMRRWKLAHIEYHNYRTHGFKIIGDNYEYIDVDKEDRKFLQRTYILPIPAAELENNSLITQYEGWL